ncbi:MAG: alpha/beta hydrolase, partial [Calditrichota bacterium]
RLNELYDKHQQKVTLIGWSLGGVFSRELARAHPDLVRQVITLGSPFGGITEVNNVTWLYERLSGREVKQLDEELVKEILQPPPVPTTAIYSKFDGVVQWQHCMESTEGPQTQNIEVLGSHFGLGHNPLVLEVITDRLSQPVDKWKKYTA